MSIGNKSEVLLKGQATDVTNGVLKLEDVCDVGIKKAKLKLKKMNADASNSSWDAHASWDKTKIKSAAAGYKTKSEKGYKAGPGESNQKWDNNSKWDKSAYNWDEWTQQQVGQVGVQLGAQASKKSDSKKSNANESGDSKSKDSEVNEKGGAKEGGAGEKKEKKGGKGGAADKKKEEKKE